MEFSEKRTVRSNVQRAHVIVMQVSFLPVSIYHEYTKNSSMRCYQNCRIPAVTSNTEVRQDTRIQFCRNTNPIYQRLLGMKKSSRFKHRMHSSSSWRELPVEGIEIIYVSGVWKITKMKYTSYIVVNSVIVYQVEIITLGSLTIR